MALQVTLIKTPENVAESGASQTVHTFDGQGGTLGRSPSNTWTLSDPDRFLSSCHCEIVFADNRYYIVDLSTNGTFVNGSPEPLGKGVKAPLADGDTFDVGDYRFSVKSVAEQPVGAGSPFAPLEASDPFGSGESAGNSPFADPFGSSPSFSEPFSLSPEAENTDPLAALDRAHSSAGDSSLGNEGGLLGDLNGGRGNDPFAGMGQVDQSASLDQAVSWPEASQQHLIPDDWEDDLLGAPAAQQPVQAPQSNYPSGPAPASPTEQVPPQSTQAGTPLVQPGSELNAGNAAWLFGEGMEESAGQGGAVSSGAELAADVPVANVIAPAASVAPIPAPAARRTVQAGADQQGAPASPAPSVSQSDRRFVAAMGLDPASLSDEQVNAISEKAGALMREIVEGMMQVLRSRTSIKNEFRMNVTTIEPFENNPLKFSVGVDEALENMFIKRSKAYKEPLEAFRESFQEIGEHQLAMIAGIRLGFEKMLTRFDPDRLQELFNKQGKSSAIPGVQKAKHWSSYRDYYDGFSDNMESSFQNLFGSDFVQAYEDQLRKLAASRKKQ